MRPSVIISAVALLGASTGVVFGDSSPALPPEPVEASPSATPAAAPAPAKSLSARAPADSARPREITPVAPVVVYPYGGAPVARPRDLVPSGARPVPSADRPNPTRVTRQAHSSYYVNRVRLNLPAGIRVTVRKDWYSDKVVLVYAANPYTTWRDVTPESFAFRHTGTTLEVVPSGIKYVPGEFTLYVPSAIKVEAL